MSISKNADNKIKRLWKNASSTYRNKIEPGLVTNHKTDCIFAQGCCSSKKLRDVARQAAELGRGAEALVWWPWCGSRGVAASS